VPVRRRPRPVVDGAGSTLYDPLMYRPNNTRYDWSFTTSRRRPDHRTAAQKRTLTRAVACSGVVWGAMVDEDGQYRFAVAL
jgi:hypothetical protein